MRPRSASRLAAELYGCQVLAENVEDRAGQRDPLRVARARERWPWSRRRADAKTSIVFWGGGDESPGLARATCCAEFADRGVNLTRIESRPAARAASATTCSSPTSRARRTAHRWARRSPRSASASRSCGCSARIHAPASRRASG